LPAQIACLGRTLIAQLLLWSSAGPAAAIDSTVLPAHGGVWHKKDRDAAVVRFLLVDTAYNDPVVRAVCAETVGILVATKRGPYPHRDGGAAVCRVFHQRCSHAIENFNGRFKALFAVRGPVPSRGLGATQRYVPGAVVVYQLTLLARANADADRRCGLLAFPRAA
jgi:hypothetical protein